LLKITRYSILNIDPLFSQKRKIKSKDKDKTKMLDDTPPFFDFTTLKSR
jgi:hypothetical protein